MDRALRRMKDHGVPDGIVGGCRSMDVTSVGPGVIAVVSPSGTAITTAATPTASASATGGGGGGGGDY